MQRITPDHDVILVSDRFPVVRSDQSVLKWNAQVPKTGSSQNVPARGSEPLSPPGRPKRGNLEN